MALLVPPNTRLERTRHERASLVSCVGEPLKRSVRHTSRLNAGSRTHLEKTHRPAARGVSNHIYDFLFVGLVPLLTLVLFLRNSDVEFSFLTTLLSVGLYFVVMGASVWACAGDNIGRWLVLSAVTLTAVIWIINAVLILSNMELGGSERPSVIGFISRGIISLVLNWWYFNRKTTVAYYKRNVAN